MSTTSMPQVELPSPILSFDQVSKVYRSYSTPQQKLREMLSLGRKQYFRETRALDEVSFALQPGDRLGVVGENGSGKSTLLKVLAGVLAPTTGKVAVRGRVSALLELGAGFTADLTGRENINQFCMLHGMHDDEIEEAVPQIIRFSELGEAVEHPVRTYSSGMSMRLGFGCAVYVQPDILIVDEALSVGDAYFQNKCLAKIRSMLDQGITFIYVTHAADAVRSLCNRGLWLDKGKVRLAGGAALVGGAYQSEIFSRMVRAGIAGAVANPHVEVQQEIETETESQALDHSLGSDYRLDTGRLEAFAARVGALRTGSGEMRIDDISVIDDRRNETDVVELDAAVRIQVFYHLDAVVPKNCALSIGITDNTGKQILHFSSAAKGIEISDGAPRVQQLLEFTFPNCLCPGEFGIVAGIGTLVAHPQNSGQSLIESVIDYCAGGARFSVPFPAEHTDHDLWGLVHCNYDVVSHSLD